MASDDFVSPVCISNQVVRLLMSMLMRHDVAGTYKLATATTIYSMSC